MNLLIATDHRFLGYESRVYDTSTFDSDFFKDYQEAFENISLIGRMAAVRSLPRHAFRSDSSNVRFIGLPDVHGLFWALLGDRFAAPIARKAVKEADALVVRVPGHAGSAAARLALKYGKPYMVEVVGDPREAIRNLGRTPLHRLIALRYARQLRSLAMHASSGSYVTSVGLPKAYPVGKDVPSLCISDIRLATRQIAAPREYKNKRSPFQIVMVANLVRYKRHQDVLHATRKVIDLAATMQVHFVGDGPCRERLEVLSGKLGLHNQVRFHGHIADRSALISLLDTSDLFVLSSGTEGLPRAMIEAMSRGLPVIASRAGGNTELVDDGELFHVGDVDALASLICSLCNDPKRLARLSASNIEKAKAFTREKLSSKRVELYRFLRERARESMNRNRCG
jgi:glycosyltransferase involved in cell wall biosynthesis